MNEKRAKSKRWQFGDTFAKCPSGKRTYRSHSDARRALRRIQSMPGDLNIRNVYRCRDCDKFHLTSNAHPYTRPESAAVA
jgi:hypothetical protein